MTNQTQTSSRPHPIFDLEDRTANFGLNVIRLCKLFTPDIITKPLISQLIRSSTSIGANYMEANGADSKKDFHAKISICKKESKETMHWLRMLSEVYPPNLNQIRILWKEAQELSLIFGSINRK